MREEKEEHLKENSGERPEESRRDMAVLKFIAGMAIEVLLAIFLP